MHETLWRAALRIRATELLLLDLFRENKLSGTVHTCVGQELCAVTLQSHLRPGLDAFFGSHRNHGHLIAHGAPLGDFLAELMGREGALCAGRGGSQNVHFQRFFSSGIQGGTALLATGFAWSQQLRGDGGIAVAQIGDGTLGEGALYESLTFAALRALPVLFYLEWNGYAQSTDVRTTTPGDVAARLAGFGLAVRQVDDLDLAALLDVTGEVVDAVRGGRPQVLIVETRRLLAHSKGDDHRDPETLAALRAADPLSQRLQRPEVATSYADVEKELRALAAEVDARPLVAAGTSRALPLRELELSSRELHADVGGASSGRIVQELNDELLSLMKERADVLIVGEDIADPYGGTFKVTRGLSSAFPERVFATPVAEAGIAGLGNGVALGGYRPVAEIMFSDFATLAADQLINHAAKVYFTYGGAVTCPITVRLVSGAGRGYGPTHSQSLESLFYGVPGLRVIVLSHRHRPGRLLREAVLDEAPTIFVEHKLLYPERPATTPPLDLEPTYTTAWQGDLPPLSYSPPPGIVPQATIVTCGGIARSCEAAMRALFVEEELSFDYFILTQLWPLVGLEAILRSVRATRRLIVVEEGYSHFGVGAAVTSEIAHRLPGTISTKLGLRSTPIPNARHLEDEVIPGASDVFNAILQLTKEPTT